MRAAKIAFVRLFTLHMPRRHAPQTTWASLACASFHISSCALLVYVLTSSLVHLYTLDAHLHPTHVHGHLTRVIVIQPKLDTSFVAKAQQSILINDPTHMSFWIQISILVHVVVWRIHLPSLHFEANMSLSLTTAQPHLFSGSDCVVQPRSLA